MPLEADISLFGKFWDQEGALGLESTLPLNSGLQVSASVNADATNFRDRQSWGDKWKKHSSAQKGWFPSRAHVNHSCVSVSILTGASCRDKAVAK